MLIARSPWWFSIGAIVFEEFLATILFENCRKIAVTPAELMNSYYFP
jgi:hypothetical protein